jgi:hypothetical protein
MNSGLQPASDLDQGSVTRTPRWIPSLHPGVLVPVLILLVAVTFNLVSLYPEVAIPAPLLNDGVLHRLALEQARFTLSTGQDLTDPWFRPVSLGYPLFHHYHHLAYLLPAILTSPFRGGISTIDLFNWTRYLLLCIFPVTIYWSMRFLGFPSLPAALSGLVASLLATNGLYGFDLMSYVWRGYGMYTQLWGMVLMPLALALGYKTIKNGSGIFWAVLLLGATLLAHLVYGYITFLSLVILAFLPIWGRQSSETGTNSNFWPRIWRLSLLTFLVILVTAYFLFPFISDSPYMNRSIWEEQGKYDAYGYQWTLRALVRGELFDYGRFPSLTLLAGFGLLFCLYHWREERNCIPVILFVLWLLLYFGRPAWGVLLDLLPFSRDLHFHRLIAGVHLGGIMLIGLGLGGILKLAGSRKTIWQLGTIVILIAALLYPVYKERISFLGENADFMEESQIAYVSEVEDITKLIFTLQQSSPGRVYAGLGGNWGKDYKVGAVPVSAIISAAGFDTVGYLYHALSLNADIMVLFDESRAEQYNLFSIRYIVAPSDRIFPEFAQPIGDFGRHRLYKVTTTGYFDLVGSDATFRGTKADFYEAASYWLGSDLLRLKQHPTIFFKEDFDDSKPTYHLSQARDVIPMVSCGLEPPRGHLISEIVARNAYSAKIEVERESYLLLKTTYHPNWHATIDGIEAETVMLMPSFVGVKVLPGNHQVRLEYKPSPWRRVMGYGSLLILGTIAFLERCRVKLTVETVSNPLVRVLSQKKTALMKTSFAEWLSSLMIILRPHFPNLAALFLLTMLAGLPLFQFKIMSGHDSLEYLPRAAVFYEGLETGQLLPRWSPEFSAGYGQPFFNFNPPLFYYLSAVFNFLGFNFIASQNLAIFTLLSLAGIGMYLLAGTFFGFRGGLVSAVAYLFAPYLMVCLYVRHALADFAAFAFLPFAFWSVYLYIQEGQSRHLLIHAVSVSLILLSSNPVAFISIPTLGFFIIWLSGIGKSMRVLLRGLGCLFLGIALAASFWLPALMERGFVQTVRLLEGYLSYTNHFVHIAQFFHSQWGYGLSQPGPNDGMAFSLGPVHLFFIGISLLLIWVNHSRKQNLRSTVIFFLVLVFLAGFFASTASRFLWDRLPLLQYLQFPWRTLSLVAVSTAFVCGFPFHLLKSFESRLKNVFMIITITAIFMTGFPKAHPETYQEINEADYSPEAIASYGLSVTTAREYEPIWVKERPQTRHKEQLTILSGQARIITIPVSPTSYEFHVTVIEPVRLQVNIFYFPGWRLFVNGTQSTIRVTDPEGLMAFSLEPGDYLVQLTFKNTPIRVLGTAISMIAMGILLVLPFWKRRLNENHKALNH